MISTVSFGQNSSISKQKFKLLVNDAHNKFISKNYNEAKSSYLESLKFVEENKGKKINGKVGYYTSNSYLSGIYERLAIIEFENKNYQESLKYLDKTKEYPFLASCGNANARTGVFKDQLYAECLIGLNKNEEALNFLIPNLMDNPYADNSKIIKISYDLLSKNFSNKSIKNKLEQSFNNLMTKKGKIYQNEFDIFFVKFLDRDIDLSHWDLDDAKTTDEREKILKEKLFKSTFYTLLTK